MMKTGKIIQISVCRSFAIFLAHINFPWTSVATDSEPETEAEESQIVFGLEKGMWDCRTFF